MSVLKNNTAYRVAIGLVVLASALVAGLVLRHSMAERSNQLAQASTLNAQSAQIDALVAHGRAVAAAPGVALSRADALTTAIPPAIDDRSILQSVVDATSQSGTTLSSESRGTATPSGGAEAVPVSLTLNGPTQGSVVHFAGILQQQARLFEVTALTFDFANGDQLQATSSAYTNLSAALPPGVGNPAS